MPIRFRCAYCNQLMGIARRKSGNVVRCPTCGGQVIVPAPQPETARQSAGKPSENIGGVFESEDIDDLLEQSPRSPSPPPPVFGQGPPPPPLSPGVGPANMGQMIQFEDDPDTSGLLLSTGKIILLIIIMLMLLALAFFGGLLVGRTSLG
jgi:DNA-directed RNA polymerase subunit RPC12/RpoP